MGEFNLLLERTAKDRIDINKTIKRSIDIPGHRGRIEAHCARVQREYFDSGLYRKEKHPTDLRSVWRDR